VIRWRNWEGSSIEGFRPIPNSALAYSAGVKGGRPPYDPVAMFKVLILAAQNNVSDARMEYLIRNRLSWLRFLGFDLGAATPAPVRAIAIADRCHRSGKIDIACSCDPPKSPDAPAARSSPMLSGDARPPRAAQRTLPFF
jgi:hypothetical protein